MPSTRRPIPARIDRRVREAARSRCGYCLSPQHLVLARLEIEHIVPLAKGGTDDESNLWLACPICNGHKSDKTEGFDPVTLAAAHYSILVHKAGGSIFDGPRTAYALKASLRRVV